ncbi:glycoside hydrolase family 108 protein [Dawidia soli]|uniref:Peptidoglycan domain protein n=1 Tax=Dawidia soli TaxID=2782352 RepID=A0AAP2GJU6_9BACT|nr:glycosyl hydrolase 108 family protein [Dawidia soli]MBT1688880.1 hypothetical protein [Dawidia soli]
MARFEGLADKLVQLEGGYVNHPADKGGPTKYGVILAVWKEHGHDKDSDGDIDAEDIKLLEKEDAYFVAKTVFWDYFKGDLIQNQSIANIIVDWGYNSGRSTAAKQVQRLLKIDDDGVVGPLTLRAINGCDQEVFFKKLKVARRLFYDNIVARKPSQAVFYGGWINRINKFQFTP